MQDNLTPFNGLHPAQAERIAFLLEECGEVIQICGKILRHGFDSYHPSDPLMTTNRTLLLREMGDVSAVMTQLIKLGDLPNPPTDEMIYSKLDRLKKYSHHQP